MRLLLPLLLIALAGCNAPGDAVKLDPAVKMTVAFLDAGWDGQTIPKSGRCRECGGMGRSPALRIGGLPPRVDEVMVEFNDLRIPVLAKNGGHGALAVRTGGRAEVMLSSVREETMELPSDVRCVHKHRCDRFGHKAGAFKAPCGCGMGNQYMMVVTAIDRVGEKSVVVARREVPMGVF